jgi:hypothetical protein
MSDVLAAHYKEALEEYKDRLCGASESLEDNRIFENFMEKGNKT